MIYVLITIGAFISIITTAIFKSITKKTKYQNLLRAIVVIISLVLFIFISIFILNQKAYQ